MSHYFPGLTFLQAAGAQFALIRLYLYAHLPLSGDCRFQRYRSARFVSDLQPLYVVTK
jgi:hypothetical protein